ncbi:ATP-binding cassette sub-family B member 6, mitochondrial [Trichinella nelsoni]|uniref:ATP-binding cassette sub-family B member 6, mitochondrial n=1 Tax=Trichinella nelsoni TaxID=6336 RepID=A0A0V0SD37_9BILA|nr:ATP-binding cassette sub-family B member 6, mitochondrial [Trichinella nelsoni]
MFFKELFKNNEAKTHDEEKHLGFTVRHMWHKVRFLIPFIWPSENLYLQFAFVFSFLLLVLGRVVNLFAPIYHKHIVDSLNYNNGTIAFRSDLIIIYVLLMFCQGGSASNGLLNNIRNYFWIGVQQHSSRQISLRLYEHLHKLSYQWHMDRKIGEVIEIMDRGVDSVNQLIIYMVFNIAPVIMDIMIAIIYFCVTFNYIFGLIVLITMAIYLIATFCITEWRTAFRRAMLKRENELQAVAVDSLMNFETIKFCNAEKDETNRYGHAFESYQKEECKSLASLIVLSFGQNVIISIGLLSGSLLCAYFISVEQFDLTPGDYVLYAAYILQLYQPLNWMGTYYRLIHQSFIDMENMFALFSIAPEAQGSDEILTVSKGKLEFRNVSFGYMPERRILKDISFIVPPGQTVAVVGPSGSGKTTLLRLVLRFYDCVQGSILIDDQNIAKFTPSSVRSHIAVVPQDTILFNQTIKFNIAFAKSNATDEEIFEAAKLAEIHDLILKLPNGYDSVVGERGLKMSGGEKQRIAIARAMIKVPSVMILDEATSSLDVETERLIQASLDKVCKGKTTLIVTHRLSTVVNANQILVMRNGRIEEFGTHTELLNKDGLYSNMWKQQMTEWQPPPIADNVIGNEIFRENISQLKRTSQNASCTALPRGNITENPPAIDVDVRHQGLGDVFVSHAVDVQSRISALALERLKRLRRFDHARLVHLAELRVFHHLLVFFVHDDHLGRCVGIHQLVQDFPRTGQFCSTVHAGFMLFLLFVFQQSAAHFLLVIDGSLDPFLIFAQPIAIFGNQIFIGPGEVGNHLLGLFQIAVVHHIEDNFFKLFQFFPVENLLFHQRVIVEHFPERASLQQLTAFGTASRMAHKQYIYAHLAQHVSAFADHQLKSVALHFGHMRRSPFDAMLFYCSSMTNFPAGYRSHSTLCLFSTSSACAPSLNNACRLFRSLS